MRLAGLFSPHHTKSKYTAITCHLTAGLYILYEGTCLNEHNTIVSPPDGCVKAVIRNPVWNLQAKSTRNHKSGLRPCNIILDDHVNQARFYLVANKSRWSMAKVPSRKSGIDNREFPLSTYAMWLLCWNGWHDVAFDVGYSGWQGCDMGNSGQI